MTPKQIIYPLGYIARHSRGDADAQHKRFCEGLSRELGLPHPCTPIGRARTGTYLLVKGYITETRRKVVMSPYTIPDLVNLVKFAGGEPVFADHAPRSTNLGIDGLEELLDEQTACVLITHYHLNQDRFDDIRTLCDSKGVALLEDCAISLGGTISGKSVGVSSNGGAFSFSSYKFLNYFWGGAIVSSDEELLNKISAEVDQWPRFQGKDYRSQWLRTFKYDLATRQVMFDLVTAPMLRRGVRKSGEAITLQPPRIESTEFDESLRSRPSAAALAEWNRKLKLVQPRLEHRRRIAAIYQNHFGDMMVSKESSDATRAASCFVNYPIWIGAKRDEVYRQMLLARFDVGLSIYPNSHEHEDFRQVPGRSTEINRLCASVLSLPTHPKVTPSYAEKLSQALKRFL
jgi:dTDP-4-amino-4,6-dideoxygalactose transaminase